MSLREYARKRHFARTPEPKPLRAPGARNRKLRFVVQKHRASHLHYDFRLEWNGALLSWAVPKGPSTDPKMKRLAVAVEDHPLSYAGFEGVIPAKEYGGGTVMVWDQGTYVPDGNQDVGDAWHKGEIKFRLHGQKLEGGWVLVRTGDAKSRTWLLIKRHDEGASSADVLTTRPRSAVSRRTMAEVAADAGGDIERAAEADPLEADTTPASGATSGKRGAKRTRPRVSASRSTRARTARQA